MVVLEEQKKSRYIPIKKNNPTKQKKLSSYIFSLFISAVVGVVTNNRRCLCFAGCGVIVCGFLHTMQISHVGLVTNMGIKKEAFASRTLITRAPSGGPD